MESCVESELNHLNELTRWLQDLNGPACLQTTSKDPKMNGTLAGYGHSAADVNGDDIIDFESILGDLNSLDHLFDIPSSPPAAATSSPPLHYASSPLPPPPRSGSVRLPPPPPTFSSYDDCLPLPPPPSTSNLVDFESCDAVLRDALSDLNTIARTVGVDDVLLRSPSSSSAAAAPAAGPSRLNGHRSSTSPAAAAADGTSNPSSPFSSVSAATGRGLAERLALNGSAETSSLSSAASTSSRGSRKNSLDNSGASSTTTTTGPAIGPKSSPSQTCVPVYLEDGVSSHMMVDDQLTAGQLCLLMMKKRNVPLSTSWSIIEQLPELYMERRIEQHEIVLEVVRNWLKGSTNRLLFVANVDRYALYDSEQQGKFGSVYDIEGSLHVKSEDKKIWKKLDFLLQSTGLCYRSASGKGGKSDAVCLQSLMEADVYLATGWRKKYKSPTEHGFALKPPYVQKKSPKCVRYLCADDANTMSRWITALRVAKYGRCLSQEARGPQVCRNSSSDFPAEISMSLPAVSYDDLSTSSNVGTLPRRKASLVPALPISTQTTRLLQQQQSRTAHHVNGNGTRDDTDQPVIRTPAASTGTSRLSMTSAASADRLSNCDFPAPPNPSVYESPSRSVVPQSAVDLPLPPPPASATLGRNHLHQQQQQQSGFNDHLSGSRSQTELTAGANVKDAKTAGAGGILPTSRKPSTSTLPRCAVPPTAASFSSPSFDSRSSHAGNTTPPYTSPPPCLGFPPSAVVRPQPPTTPVRAAGNGTPPASVQASPARAKPPPPRRSENTKLSFSAADQRQTRTFILNLDRVITQKGTKGCTGLTSLPVPLPPRPAYDEGPTYLDTDDLPPPPAELLDGLRAMRRQNMPLPPIPPPNRR